MKILVFTDSRGQHKPAGQDHQMFGERLAADPRLNVDLFLCPMKWTTTLDFLEMFDEERLRKYDGIVLYTGIVDWSPRPVSSAIHDLYNNLNCLNAENVAENTRDYSRKVVNNKKNIFDTVFGADALRDHFGNPFDAIYNGEKTVNMYGLEMARRNLLPRLLSMKNLVFVSANRFVHGWEGDYKKTRPQNMMLTHRYSDDFSDTLNSARVVDLREWGNSDVVKLTCDNLHLSKAGSDYIFDKVAKILDIKAVAVHSHAGAKEVNKLMQPMQSPERINGEKKFALLKSVGASEYLATLVIGFRLKEDEPDRRDNLLLLLKWVRHYYSDLFDVLLVEQDSAAKFDPAQHGLGDNVRYEFIHNPADYNRGWGYNVAVKQFCRDSTIVALMDTDVLTSRNFLREVLDCYTKYDAISPYQNIYYTDADETTAIGRSLKIEGLGEPSKIKNPVTVAGGILIIKRSTFLALKGFEQYVGYGCEDRAFDVSLINHVPEARIRIAPYSYAHLHHASDTGARSRFKEIYAHLIANYGCKYEPGLSPFDSIHKACKHASVEKTVSLLRQRAEHFGDPEMYRDGAELTVNGLPVGGAADKAPSSQTNVIYPPDFTSVFDYKEKEVYKAAPEPDSLELASFYNAYKGKRCFIIGNGPSLNKHDLSLLENEYTFGVNSFYYKTRECGFTPFFYVVEDSSVMKENIEEIRKYDAPFKFFPTNYKSIHPKQPNTFFFRMNRGFYEKSSPNFVIPRFSTDASDVLYCGQSVTYINLQLAHFMGFEEVYLIGMDFSYVIPESHARSGDVLLSDTDDPNHFHKDYFGKGKTWKDPKLDRVALNYRMAKLAYESTGRRVFNATVGGSLEVFDRVDYASLFAGGPAHGASTEAPTLREANGRYRDRNYSQALSAYIELARQHGGFQLYKRCAVDSYMRAAQAGQTCAAGDVAYVRGLLFGM